MMKNLICGALFGLVFLASPAQAAEAEKDKSTNAASAKKDDSKKDDARLAPVVPDATRKPVLATNTVTIAGQAVTYTVETGMLPLLKSDGGTRASVFYIAYTRAGETNPAARPVTYCFNGGPGSSSVWLHLGGLGPRRVKVNDDGTLPPPPFGLVDNEFSLLHVTDLVFIDPVATGFSRPAKDEKADQFFGQSADVESVGEFIRLWTTRNLRWRSPKFLCGESYGVFRAAGLAEHLHGRYGMYLNGLLLVSGVLDFATLREGPGNDLPALVFLPTYTATAQFHKKLPPDLQNDLPRALVEAREFMHGEYASALLQGAALPAAQRQRVVAKLARLTGLPEKLIDDEDLRVSPSKFRELLLRDENLILGRYDARLTGRDADRSSSSPRFDPSYAATYGPFSAAMNAYLREELKFENDLPYEILAGVGPWPFDARDSFPSSASRLASAMNQNPYLRVLVLVGLRDLATPVDGIRHSIDHLQLAPEFRRNVTYAEYEAGHMMYINLPDLRKMQRDMETFLKP
jgi:carboxypeptidase C (cathepsin A)